MNFIDLSMQYYIKTFGCQMNYADSERLRTIFNNYGLTETDNMSDASYIVLNSCAIREKAEEKLLGHGKFIKKYKSSSAEEQENVDLNETSEGKYPIVILTGCMVKAGINGRVRQSTPDEIRSQLLNKIKWLDYAYPTQEVFGFLESLLSKDEHLLQSKRASSCDDVNLYLDRTPTPYSKVDASLPISVGCNHHCSFCTVPFSRGRETFRTYGNIEKEYLNYVSAGYKQITLLGQTVNKWLNPNFNYPTKAYAWYRYGEVLPNAIEKSSNEPDNFLTLLKSLDAVKGDYWLNFMSSYPNYFTEELIDFISESIKSEDGHITPTIHLAVQSGSNSMLEKMNRHYTVEEFKNIVNRFRKNVPDISITTDVIVGYPTETKEEFEETLNLCEEMKFDMIYISEFSKRKHTPAEDLKEDISLEDKRNRKNAVNDILERNLENRNKSFVVKTLKVLVSKHYRNNLIGRSGYGKDVEIALTKEQRNSDTDMIGKFLNVEITESGAWGMRGKIKNTSEN